MLVGKRLVKLGPAWRVLHSIPVGSRGTDIDHLVIGPGGVFSLNTKNHLGQRVWVHTDVVKVNGQSRNYLRVSEHEAQKAGPSPLRVGSRWRSPGSWSSWLRGSR